MTTTAERVLTALRPYDLKPDGAKQWRCNSPLRPGSNSHGFRLVIDGDEHGAYDDKVNGDSGSLYELAGKLGIEVTPRTEVADTKRVYRDLADYASAHGTTADALIAVGWQDKTTYQGREALAFKTKTGTRYRFIDGEKPYYKSELGYHACWYGLNAAVNMAREKNTALVICNGEVSTVAAQQRGIPACCKTGGEEKLPAALVDELNAAWSGAIWLAFDCDQTGQRVAGEVAAQLPNATVIDLGLSDKGDLADFAMLYTTEALDKLRSLAVVAPKHEAQMSDVELLTAALKGLTSAIRRDETAELDIPTALAQARAQIDRVEIKLARPVVRSFKDIVQQELANAYDRYALAVENGGKSVYEIEGLRSYIPAIDDVLHGFRPEVYVIYGATGMGKTFFTVSLAREFLKQAPGFIVSTELQPGRWLNRLIASIAQVSASDIRRGVYTGKDDWRRVKDAYEMLASMNCHILDASSPTPSLVRSAYMEGMNKGYGYEWLLIDSASKMRYPGTSDIYAVTRGVSNDIQDMMREFDVPVIVTSQVGRDVADRGAGKKAPQLEDGYGGGTIEQNAGVVVGLYYHHYYVKRGQENPRDDLPEGTVVAQFLKMRDEDDSDAPTVKLEMRPGMGFYEHKTKPFDPTAFKRIN